MASQAINSPIPTEKLHQIATDACNTTFFTTRAYEHSRTATWNTTIINTILHSLLSTSTTEENTSPQYKFIVTSTIIQHAPPKPSATSSSSTSTSTSTAAITTLEATPLEDAKSESTPTTTAPAVSEPAATSAAGSSGGKRGMHSATGAYWNSEKDGMWSFKWDGGERGFDVVVSVVWVGV